MHISPKQAIIIERGMRQVANITNREEQRRARRLHERGLIRIDHVGAGNMFYRTTKKGMEEYGREFRTSARQRIAQRAYKNG